MDSAIRTDIIFVAGIDGYFPTPPAARKAGLTHRFAVIQETYRAGSADMYFDEALWLAILDFACSFSSGAEARIGKAAQTREAFLQAWSAASEKDPADYIEVHGADGLILFVATELWSNVGGPAPYADSITYSLHSREDIGGQVMAHLRNSDGAHRWMLAADAIPARPKKKLWGILG